ncbi:hypothetical protein BT63DRAFT_442244 [Microthyrium microscopicum]|uniref:Alpha/beta-hydrolase n=1 Tax=Microthyrium microscopicum TaxID=703497 RepID=A0A6A6U2R1_9PEZI|nr:hypothetical protein BT63DRAFT_442244 [Microthyrium microscopicum]
MRSLISQILFLLASYVAAAPQGTAPVGDGKQKGDGGLSSFLEGLGLPKMSGFVYPPEYLKSEGTGKFPAHFYSEPTLPKHTIFAPKNLPAGTKTPILVWGEGACMNNGLEKGPLLLQLASQGVTILANGVLPADKQPPAFATMTSTGQTLKENMMAQAIDWAEKQKSTEKWAHLDTSRIAAAGQSCGGLETLVMATDKRVKSLGIFNSGSAIASGGVSTAFLPLPNNGSVPDGSKINVPTFFFLGGAMDVATAKNHKDYEAMPEGVPAWAADYKTGGHGGTYNELNAGSYGVLGSHWLKYVLLGDKESAEFFKQDKATGEGWLNLKKKNLEKIAVV